MNGFFCWGGTSLVLFVCFLSFLIFLIKTFLYDRFTVPIGWTNTTHLRFYISFRERRSFAFLGPLAVLLWQAVPAGWEREGVGGVLVASVAPPGESQTELWSGPAKLPSAARYKTFLPPRLFSARQNFIISLNLPHLWEDILFPKTSG